MSVLSSTSAHLALCVEWASEKDEYTTLVHIYARISFLKYLQAPFSFICARSFQPIYTLDAHIHRIISVVEIFQRDQP